jgi:hypothetical protein
MNHLIEIYDNRNYTIVSALTIKTIIEKIFLDIYNHFYIKKNFFLLKLVFEIGLI